jgi:thymidylate synthase (FAD)
MPENQIDPLFSVAVIARTPNPQTVAYAKMHQCYSEGCVAEELITSIHDGVLVATHKYGETKCGELAVKHLLAGNRGHYSPLEGPQITFSVGYFPHSVMQQSRTHRISVAHSVQSGRYSGKRICDLVEELGFFSTEDAGDVAAIEKVFYLRPVGDYHDREGKKYRYTEDHRRGDLEECWRASVRYAKKIKDGFSEEHSRDMNPFGARQHWCVSFNCRSFMHFLDLRSKKDAQPEIQQLCDMMWPHFQDWMPEIAEWYRVNRWAKARLSP